VEKRDNSTFEFGSSACVDGSRREGFPDDGFADVCGDKEGDTGAETIAFLKKLVEEKNDETSDKKLDNDEERQR